MGAEATWCPRRGCALSWAWTSASSPPAAQKGQLGHGDTLLRNLPTVVSKLSKYNIIAAGVGRNHTVVVTDDGSTAGLPQYGQLGHGSDNEYNANASSVRLTYDPQPHPRAIAALSGKTVVKVACGTNHTVAVDSSGFVYTWGFGGYGRLGHNEQKDEWQPRLVEIFQKNNMLSPSDIISAGSASSACTAGGRGQLYVWGKLKNWGDECMYPKPVRDLSGWNIRCMASGDMHHIVGAEDSCISWGLSEYGELGYGPTQKSSVNPKKVDILEGMHVTSGILYSYYYPILSSEQFCSVGCGVGMSLIVVDRANVGDKLDQTSPKPTNQSILILATASWIILMVILMLSFKRTRKSSTFFRAETVKKNQNQRRANIPQSTKQSAISGPQNGILIIPLKTAW
uniref:Uncharacterized protein n=1 Tax=Aegilops tauschii TaxID=37682 RepID=R7WET7_AEGTA